MDRSGWHQAKDLKIPSNIHIVYGPPYALNPVKSLWLYINPE